MKRRMYVLSEHVSFTLYHNQKYQCHEICVERWIKKKEGNLLTDKLNSEKNTYDSDS